MDENSQLVIIQPTPFCNIDCRYCYLQGRSSTDRLSISTLERILDAVFSSSYASNKITIVWHAGEPLTLPISFYERAYDVITDRCPTSTQISTAIQTNGTLITQQWCDLFLRHNVNVGVSIDGPRPIHDA